MSDKYEFAMIKFYNDTIADREEIEFAKIEDILLTNEFDSGYLGFIQVPSGRNNVGHFCFNCYKKVEMIDGEIVTSIVFKTV